MPSAGKKNKYDKLIDEKANLDKECYHNFKRIIKKSDSCWGLSEYLIIITKIYCKLLMNRVVEKMKWPRFVVAVSLLIQQQVHQAHSLPCILVPSILDDGELDIFEYSCQVGDRMLPIDNHLQELEDFLESPAAIDPDFDLDFEGASIVDHTFHIPANATMFFHRQIDKESGEASTGNRRHSRSRRRLGGENPSGDQRVLVLYVVDKDGNSPTASKDGEAGSTEDNIFGTYGDTVYPGERVSVLVSQIVAHIRNCNCNCGRFLTTTLILSTHDQ